MGENSEIKVIDRRRFTPTIFCERDRRAANVLKLYGTDAEGWFRRYWVECFHETMLVDDETAIMTQKEFDSLKEYSASMPSGVYAAKRWKRDVNESRRYAIMTGRTYASTLVEREQCQALKLEDFPPVWWMGEYIELNEKELLTRWRKIIVV
jgi:hypothetical protein